MNRDAMLLSGVMIVSVWMGSQALADKVVLNETSIPKWEMPSVAGENWRFYPIEWTTQSLVKGTFGDFELTTTMAIGDYVFADPPFDTDHYMRSMSMAQFHFQGGLVLRHQDWRRHYRLEFSVKDQSVALWKPPENFLAVAECPIFANKPFQVKVRAAGPRITVSVNGKPLLDVVDRVEPVLSGTLLAGANHARVSADAVAVQALDLAPPASPEPLHQPAFAVRTWCGYRWIFDGAEPIARLGEGKDGKAWEWFEVGLFEAKLRPGTRTAGVIPLTFTAPLNWPEKPIEVVKAALDGVTLRAHASNRTEKKPADVTAVSDVIVTYDRARDTYLYDIQSTMSYLSNQAPNTQILDPFPHSVSGPAHALTKPWDGRYTIVLLRGVDNKVYTAPLNHFDRPVNMELSADKPWYGFFGETDVNPVFEIVGPSLRHRYRIGCCTVMLDMHTFPCADLPPVAAGTVQRDAWRVSSCHGKEAAELLGSAVGLHPAYQAQKGEEIALFAPAGTTFSENQVIDVTQSSWAQGFIPNSWYAIDKTVGHSDHRSLRMDAARGSYFVKARDGLGDYGQVFDGSEMTLTLYVKTQDLAGSFRVKVVFGVDGPEGSAPASQAFSGTTEGWQKVSLRCAPKASDPRAEIRFMMEAKPGAKGSVWIDDVSFLPSH